MMQLIPKSHEERIADLESQMRALRQIVGGGDNQAVQGKISNQFQGLQQGQAIQNAQFQNAQVQQNNAQQEFIEKCVR